jgi:hypothetical protein
MSEVDERALARAAKEAFLIHDQLADMRVNVQHVSDLTGITAFLRQFNERIDEVRAVVAPDPAILKTLQFLRPIDTDVSGSEYPSAIIDGKRGLFLVVSGVLMTALKNFMRLYLGDTDRERLGAAEILRRG